MRCCMLEIKNDAHVLVDVLGEDDLTLPDDITETKLIGRGKLSGARSLDLAVNVFLQVHVAGPFYASISRAKRPSKNSEAARAQIGSGIFEPCLLYRTAGSALASRKQ